MNAPISVSGNRYVNVVQAAGSYILYGLRHAPKGEYPESIEQQCVTLDGVKYISDPLGGSGSSSISRDELSGMKQNGRIPKAFWPYNFMLSIEDQAKILSTLS